MPIRNITPSSYVGPQVRKWRDKKGWSQQKLADRLGELGIPRWSQTKIHKLEADKLAGVLVDDVFALAVALDVSPLYLLTPLEGHDENGNAFKVWLGAHGEHEDTAGGRVHVYPSYEPWVVRQWVRGIRPILNLGDSRDDERARSGQRFYLLESQPFSEWTRIEECGKQARRIKGAAAALQFGNDDGE
jgi:transcriptional regulator with XRE-family HTH domain